MATRTLPERQNSLLLENIPEHSDLVNRRALGQTKLLLRNDADSHFSRVFDYAHLRAPLPKNIMSGIFPKGSPSSYFLMRRSLDGYVSATGMFKVTFPYALAEEEDRERQYIKSLPATSLEETAGNVWITPDQALVLAEEYSIGPWIRALLDPTDIPMSSATAAARPNSPPKVISAPPAYFHGVSPPTPTSLPRPISRSRRSASPAKSTAPKRNTASPRKRSTRASSVTQQPASEPTSKAQSPEQPESNLTSVPSLPAPVAALDTVTEDVVLESKETEEETEPVSTLADEEPKVKIQVDQDVTVDSEGVETTHTSVEVEMPLFAEQPSAEDAMRLVAEAKEMVRAVTESNAAPALPTTEESVASAQKSKRKAEDISIDEEEELAPAEDSAPRAKKVKTEAEQKRDRVRRRALFGISATLAFGAASAALAPFVMSML